jgi:hypothetical protein
MMELYLHSPTIFRGVVLNSLSTGKTLTSYLYSFHGNIDITSFHKASQIISMNEDKIISFKVKYLLFLGEKSHS